jgi:hypothetical protein
MPPAGSTAAGGLYKVEQETGGDRTRRADFSQRPGQKTTVSSF